VVNAVTVPVVADTDTGYGNAINVMRTVREFEQAGVSAVIFEDQEVPKRCPCVATTLSILPLEEGAAKIKAAVHARRNPHLVIVARTDAIDVEDAIARAKAYVAAGADMVQPISRCFTNLADLKRLREACGVPLSLQLLGWLEKDLTPADIQAIAGLAVYPLVGLMTVTHSLRQNFSALHQQHSTQQLPLPVTEMNDFKKFIGFAEVEALQNQFLRGKSSGSDPD
jgi:methylisocitrate lyase